MKLLALFRAIWSYRHFVLSSIANENRARFARSKLGWLWMILNPLGQALVLALVLSKVLSAKFEGINSEYAYAMYLLSGSLGWALFTEITTRCLTLFQDNANALKKINFPRVTLPIIVVGSALLNHFLLAFCTLSIFIALGHGIQPVIAWLPVVMVINIAFALGLGLLLGIINVFLRDISQAFPMILQFWFWMTPIVYQSSMLPDSFTQYMRYNPMFYIIKSYQNILTYQIAPAYTDDLLWMAAGSLGLLGLAFIIFRRASSDIVDEL
jgi:lipopolysaccharide transport system permease protein